jgi:hypothetical protein
MEKIEGSLVYKSDYGLFRFDNIDQLDKMINDLKNVKKDFIKSEFKKDTLYLIEDLIENPNSFAIYPYESSIGSLIAEYMDEKDDLEDIIDVDASLIIIMEQDLRNIQATWKLKQIKYIEDSSGNRYNIKWKEAKNINEHDSSQPFNYAYEIIDDIWDIGSERKGANASIPICLIIGKNERTKRLIHT